jgi:hypothetical protein
VTEEVKCDKDYCYGCIHLKDYEDQYDILMDFPDGIKNAKVRLKGSPWKPRFCCSRFETFLFNIPKPCYERESERE